MGISYRNNNILQIRQKSYVTTIGGVQTTADTYRKMYVKGEEIIVKANTLYSESTYNSQSSTTNTSYVYNRSYYTTFVSTTATYTARTSVYVSSVVQNNLATNGATASTVSPFYRYATVGSTTATLTAQRVSRSHYTTKANTTGTTYNYKVSAHNRNITMSLDGSKNFKVTIGTGAMNLCAYLALGKGSVGQTSYGPYSADVGGQSIAISAAIGSTGKNGIFDYIPQQGTSFTTTGPYYGNWIKNNYSWHELKTGNSYSAVTPIMGYTAPVSYGTARASVYVSSVVQNNLATNGATASTVSPFYRYATVQTITGYGTCSRVSRSHYTTKASTTGYGTARKANYVSSQQFTQAGSIITSSNTNTASNYFVYSPASASYYTARTSLYVGSTSFESSQEYSYKATESTNATFYRYSSELAH